MQRIRFSWPHQVFALSRINRLFLFLRKHGRSAFRENIKKHAFILREKPCRNLGNLVWFEQMQEHYRNGSLRYRRRRSKLPVRDKNLSRDMICARSFFGRIRARLANLHGNAGPRRFLLGWDILRNPSARLTVEPLCLPSIHLLVWLDVPLDAGPGIRSDIGLSPCAYSAK